MSPKKCYRCKDNIKGDFYWRYRRGHDNIRGLSQGEYQYRRGGTIFHYFCKPCGVKFFR